MANIQVETTSITSAKSIDTSIEADCPSFGTLLEDQGISYTKNNPYLIVGELPEKPGWHLHLSGIRPELPDLIKAVIPVLKEAQVPFRIPMDDIAAHQILCGKWGYDAFAKVINIFPDNKNQLVQLAQRLVLDSKQFNGPIIPTAAHLGGLVYTQYIGHEKFDPANWPFKGSFSMPAVTKNRSFEGKYRITHTLKTDLKGNVYKGLFLKSWFTVLKCVIKEGKKNMWTDHGKRDMGDRLRWQHRIMDDLKNDVNVPKLYDLFVDDGNSYLVMEFIQGKSLADFIRNLYQNRAWPELTKEEKNSILNIVKQIISIVEKLHQRGYVHRDLTPVNFLLTSKGEIFLIDMELAYHRESNFPAPPFGNGTPGFMSPEQATFQVPTVKEDIYGLAGLMTYCFTNKSPVTFTIEDREKLIEELSGTIRDKQLARLIQSCYASDPNQRTTLQDIREKLNILT